ncbi:DUF4352 domain-containing protein [Actinomyces sp. B33]|uniref:hypothetical protein n=1 Tax=Actinomyces sp. B33 TaxID=2942131 RepID=UPI0023409D6F|nr:hypothetical protein [Actinomyces sp. B33]MDC4233729.1 DUF4352 domain-containing protein [Actinomyces sp. B33]
MLSCIPGIVVLGWILLPVSFVLGIVAALQKNRPHGTGIAAIVVSIIGTFVAIIAFVFIVGHAVDQALHTDVSVDSSTSGAPAQGSEAEASSPADDEAPAGSQAGATRDNPVALGTMLSSKDWQVTINSVDLDAAALLTEENMFNEPPADGETYILINMTATYIGDEAGGATPWASVDYVSPEGKSYDTTTKFLIAPESFDRMSTLYNGASTTGNIAIAVPSANVEAGVLAVQADILSDKVFVAVQ